MSRLEGIVIDPDIRRASTLPSWAYADPDVLAAARERVFAPSWQLVADLDRIKVPGQVVPLTLLEGLLDQPLLLTRDRSDRLHCLSNVCTHRGNLVAESEGVEPALRCRYHGRRFGLDGCFLSMPEFEQAEGFPTPADDLPRIAFGAWEKFVFASLDPRTPLEETLGPIRARCAWMPLRDAVFDPSRSREYLVRANWALYCDNYLEGFHIPYVHAGLVGVLDYGSYRTELFPGGSLQVGVAGDGEDAFDLPAGTPDHGQRIAAYYFWLYPNTMFNVYPWGISVNVVRPLAVDRTKVSFLPYVWDAARLDRGAGAALDRVEREDEVIVENVQRGLRSRAYERGRYSPTREQGVHHFHRMLAESLAGNRRPGA
ncbi:MAG: aromatic ring-hydroxylating oxygenase subunit alpha [Candidatus Eiseniibacteriota bacterium]